MLRQLASDLWVTERPQSFLGVQVGTRMTVARLADGGLFVHSPVALDADTRRDLDALGPVRLVVAPNRFHHLYVGPYGAAYPQARLLAAPGLPEKRCDLRFHGVLADAPAVVPGEVEQMVFAAMALMGEVVFWHRASRTLLLTDLAFNMRQTPSALTRTLLVLDGAWGRFAIGRLERLLFRDRAAARATVDRILAWDFDRVVVAHGDVVERDGQAVVRDAFAWLGKPPPGRADVRPKFGPDPADDPGRL